MCPTAIVHGWRDDVIPVENSIGSPQQEATLHLVDSDHGLLDQIARSTTIFVLPLRRRRTS
jgi:hypothetical protein